MEKKTPEKPGPRNMSQAIKTDPLPTLRAHCQRRSRAGKTRLPDELCEDFGYERKHAVKLLRDTAPAPCHRFRGGA
jgi:hypothetical protein